MANELQNRFNNLFNAGDEFFNDFNSMLRPFVNVNLNRFADMKSDVKETDKDFVVAIDLPGVDKKNIKVDFKDDVLTVSAKRDSFSDESDSEGNVIQSERSYGQLQRQYRFRDVDRDKVSAKYEDGVLTVTLPKSQEVLDNHKHIEIE